MTKVAAVRELASKLDGTGAVIGTDADGTIVYWSREAEELYGWHSSEAIGRNVVDVTPSTMSQTQAGDIMNTLLQGHAWSGEFVVRDRHGTPRIVQVDDYPVVHDGNVVGIVGVSRPAAQR